MFRSTRGVMRPRSRLSKGQQQRGRHNAAMYLVSFGGSLSPRRIFMCNGNPRGPGVSDLHRISSCSARHYGPSAVRRRRLTPAQFNRWPFSGVWKARPTVRFCQALPIEALIYYALRPEKGMSRSLIKCQDDR